jgi:2-amino-4-hydroxy-6-hydroxymethyldihydropteridine diphosphokinase
MSTVYIALGSNLGDRRANIARAIELLEVEPKIHIERVSSLYETEPVGFTEQPDFINAVARLNTELSARELLSVVLGVENIMGRKRTIRWGPRVIDVDILIYNDERISEPDLEVPHPRMAERRFVLEPLAEIAPDLVISDGRTVAEALADLRAEDS